MTAPSPYYRQHVAIEPPRIDASEFRPYGRILRRIDDLLHAKPPLITNAEFHAACDFRELVERARAGDLRSTLGETGGGATQSDADVARIDDITRLKAVFVRLRRKRFRLLIDCVVDNATWKALGRLHGIDHRTARRQVAGAIRLLAIIA